jgi:flagellar protein FliS
LDNAAASIYRSTTAQSASAVGRVVALFDTVLRDFQRALVAVDNGSVETRVFELNHALTVIGELQGVLDFERGGVAAKQFEQFYNVTRGLIVSANVQVSRESILTLIELYKPIRQAWQEVDRKLPPVEAIETRKSSATKPPASPPAPNPFGTTPAPDAPLARWSA